MDSSNPHGPQHADPVPQPQHRHTAEELHPQQVEKASQVQPLGTDRLDAALRLAQWPPVRRAQPSGWLGGAPKRWDVEGD